MGTPFKYYLSNERPFSEKRGALIKYYMSKGGRVLIRWSALSSKYGIYYLGKNHVKWSESIILLNTARVESTLEYCLLCASALFAFKNEMLSVVCSKYSGRPILIFFIQENWICAITRHHAKSNINLLLTRTLLIDSSVREWGHTLVIPLHCLWFV